MLWLLGRQVELKNTPVNEQNRGKGCRVVGMPKSPPAVCFHADSETSQQTSRGGQCRFLRKSESGAGKPGATDPLDAVGGELWDYQCLLRWNIRLDSVSPRCGSRYAALVVVSLSGMVYSLPFRLKPTAAG